MSCEQIVISDRAYNSIVTETLYRISTETGGIFLGKIIDSIWYIIEIIDPGPKSIFSYSHFEYDLDHVNYLAKVIARQYKNGLIVLGLWHRHPGSLDTFSRADDLTNQRFAELNLNGAISGLINLDPKLRFTFYHVNSKVKYVKIPFIVGDNFIPKHLLTLSYPPSLENPIAAPFLISEASKKKGKSFWITNFFPFKKSKVKKYSPKYNVQIKDIKLDNIRNVSNEYEEYLLDLYAGEEYDIETTLGLKYECTVTEILIKYEINEFLNGKVVQPSISFHVSFDEGRPQFFSDGKRYQFSKGIFVRYAQSKLEGTTFEG
jgi:proteasome lid subunit RPN8/RPN11